MTLPPKIPSLPPLPLMASPDGNNQQQQQQQQAWVPYEAAKDCSQGFCSIYCPQWCYIIFPPPPPFSFVDEDDSSSSGTAFSPLVIAIIGILASAFLLVTYYTIISKYCGGFRRRRPRRGPLSPDDPAADDDDGGDQDQSQRHETWHVSSNGLDEALISKISVYKYRRGEGLIDGADCSVCLGEFREDESLRLLPKCSHAFHVQCIDTWLRSHSNCPLCRANIVSVGPPLPLLPPQQQLPAPPLSSPETSHGEVEGEGNQEAVVVIDDLEEETSSDSDGDGSKENSEGRDDNHHDIIEIRDDEGVQHFRRSFSMDSLQRGRVSIADILQQSMEDEFMVAKDQGLQLTGSGSSSRGREENCKGGGGRSRGLHCVMSPVSMKRSVSSGRFSLNRQGKGRNSVLPI